MRASGSCRSRCARWATGTNRTCFTLRTCFALRAYLTLQTHLTLRTCLTLWTLCANWAHWTFQAACTRGTRFAWRSYDYFFLVLDPIDDRMR